MDTLEDLERYKYEAVWRCRDYRKHSPGEELVHDFLRRFNPPKDSAIIDLGCGTGRAAFAFAVEGFDVIAIDHAENCLDPEPAANQYVRFVRSNLWDENLPSTLDSDFIGPPTALIPDFYTSSRPAYGYCTDVMEHIPRLKVWPTLINLSRIPNLRGIFFNISCMPDLFGEKILGEPLHLTVDTPGWWTDILLEIFPYCETMFATEESIAIMACTEAPYGGR